MKFREGDIIISENLIHDEIIKCVIDTIDIVDKTIIASVLNKRYNDTIIRDTIKVIEKNFELHHREEYDEYEDWED